MRHVIGLTLAASVAILATVPAQPALSDDLASIQSSMTAAYANVRSFRVELALIGLGAGMTALMTIEREPMRMHMVMNGPMTMENYVTDGFVYMRMGNTGWKKLTLPPAAASLDMVREWTASAHVVAGSDVVEDGVTYGTLDFQSDRAMLPGAAASLTGLKMTCTYDKKTFLMHDCKSARFTELVVGYNDPANEIALPADLSTAVDMGVIPLPAPAPTQSPK
jgi:hypothetical protein